MKLNELTPGEFYEVTRFPMRPEQEGTVLWAVPPQGDGRGNFLVAVDVERMVLNWGYGPHHLDVDVEPLGEQT
jgi:hypothetical protein